MSVQMRFPIHPTLYAFVSRDRRELQLVRWAAVLREFLALEWPGWSVDVRVNTKRRTVLLGLDGPEEADAQRLEAGFRFFHFRSITWDFTSIDADAFDPLRWALVVLDEPEWVRNIAVSAVDTRVRDAAVDVLMAWLGTGYVVGSDARELVEVLTSRGLLSRGHLLRLLRSEHRSVREAAMMVLPRLATSEATRGTAGERATESDVSAATGEAAAQVA